MHDILSIDKHIKNKIPNGNYLCYVFTDWRDGHLGQLEHAHAMLVQTRRPLLGLESDSE